LGFADFEYVQQQVSGPGYLAGHVTREQTKQKVDVLGSLLKKHVSKLRSGEQFFSSL
jgi:hypothetical protein